VTNYLIYLYQSILKLNHESASRSVELKRTLTTHSTKEHLRVVSVNLELRKLTWARQVALQAWWKLTISSLMATHSTTWLAKISIKRRCKRRSSRAHSIIKGVVFLSSTKLRAKALIPSMAQPKSMSPWKS